jgi:hypothetical protein
LNDKVETYLRNQEKNIMTIERQREIAYPLLLNQASRAKDPTSVIRRNPKKLAEEIGVKEASYFNFTANSPSKLF